MRGARPGGGGGAPEEDDRADLALAVEAVERAGEAVMRAFGRPQEVVHKAPDQPLTPADLEADRILHRALLAARPTYGWLSEESADSPERLGAERLWIVDPIDGTWSFIEGRPEFGISVGLVVRGRVRVGVVYNPASGELFWAVRGEGAWRARVPRRHAPLPFEAVARSARRLTVRRPEPGERPVMLVSRSELLRGAFDMWREAGWRIEAVGSTSYKMALVAAGEGDAFLSWGGKGEWDVCAGELLVEEAGGRATDVEGRAFRYNRPDPRVRGVLVSNGIRHDDLLAASRGLEGERR